MASVAKCLRTVLVVEDSADDFYLLERASRQVPAALAFHSVPSGEQAMAYLKGEGSFADRQAHPLPDLVLLDIKLPGIDGLEVLAWIRSQPELENLKVFVWTDAGQPDLLERATRAGADRFVPKSVAFVRGGLAGLVSGISQAIVASPEESHVRAPS
jgi:CheY-like chemotaxis protein